VVTEVAALEVAWVEASTEDSLTEVLEIVDLVTAVLATEVLEIVDSVTTPLEEIMDL
jgi:hypothetical protein